MWKIAADKATLDFFNQVMDGDFSFVFRSDDWDRTNALKVSFVLANVLGFLKVASDP